MISKKKLLTFITIFIDFIDEENVHNKGADCGYFTTFYSWRDENKEF